jgi:alkylation response protein AidB-like acyl-CoA dehydrogenase
VTPASTDEDRVALAEAARRLLEREAGPARLREVIDRPEPWDAELWRKLAGLGWPGIAVAEADGGAGGSFADLAVVVGELGRWLVPGPFFATAVLAAGALSLGGDSQQRAHWLKPLATGSATGTLATCGSAGRPGWAGLGVRWQPGAAGSLVLDGAAAFVPDAATADLIVIACQDGSGPGGVRLVVLEAASPGLSTTTTPTFDLTRHLGEVRCDGVRVGPEAVLDAAALGRILDRAAIAVAVESAAAAARVLEGSAAYAASREQFGRPIGTFQAIKHRCADMAILAASSRVAAGHAVTITDAQSVELDPGNTALARAASVAKSHAADSYAAVAADAIQLHGGIGFSWEHDAHLHLRRAKLNQALFGDSRWHRDRLAGLALATRATLHREGDTHVDR